MKENKVFSNINPKKHVRFNSSLKMATSPSDHQLPRPLTDLQNKNNQNAPKPIHFVKDREFLPSKVSQPVPCDDLELSVLDSSYIISNGLENGNSKVNSKWDLTGGGLGDKLLQNDMPYCFSPSKMPMRSVCKQMPSEGILDLNPALTASAAHSKKDFRFLASDTDSGMGFFTLPNSAGLYDEKRTPRMSIDKAATAKHNSLNSKPIFPITRNEDNFNKKSENQPDTNKRDKFMHNQKFYPNINYQNLGVNYNDENIIFKTQFDNANSCSNSQQRFNKNFKSQNDIHQQNGICQPNGMRPQNGGRVLSPSDDGVNQFNCQRAGGCGVNVYPNVGLNGVMPTNCTAMPADIACCAKGCTDHQYVRANCCVQSACCNRIQQNVIKEKKPESISDSLEIKRTAILARENKGKENKNDVICNVENKDPTVSDLYEIIKLQNEQLLMLQKRVDRLLTAKETIEPQQKMLPKEINLITDVHTTQTDASVENLTPNNAVNLIEHISIGVMTSFELVMSSNYVNKRSVTFKQQTPSNDSFKDGTHRTHASSNEGSDRTNNLNTQFAKSPNGGNFLDGIARCNKSHEDDSGDANKLSNSNVLMDRAEVNTDSSEQMRTCENSPIEERNEHHLDETTDECSQPNIGWTFYNNVMNRVNNMLHSPPAPSHSRNVSPHQVASQNPRIVATERLTNVLESPLQMYPSSAAPVTELSLHMRQLAAKYNVSPRQVQAPPAAQISRNPNFFPDDVRNPQFFANDVRHSQMYRNDVRHQQFFTNDGRNPEMNVNDARSPQMFTNDTRNAQLYANDARNPQIFANDMRNEMSFATMQYMQRYQLLSVSNEPRRQQPFRIENTQSPTCLKPAYNNPSRILDITTLKQQPKLL